ncbi:hypothetical protein [Spirosoma montaniterrae]|uniref:hypothetical protein n=1 Tax=Spirosoma montaniterrae TaxID=1178516 RepID=UPI0012FA5B1B|nr:hypothetical protein [Spirosoma montaniterrae]
MRKKLTTKQQQHVIRQTLTPTEINRLENYPDARPVSHTEFESLIAASKKQVKESA